MINIIGSFFGCDGYSNHTRNLVRALDKVTDVRVTTGAVPNWERMVDDKELELLKKQSVENEINLIVTNPLHWRLNATAKRNWVYLVAEGDKIPECFIEECLNPNIEYIFVPSQHVKEAFYTTLIEHEGVIDKSYWNDKIKLIPHGVDLKLFYPKEKPNKCIFLANKGFRNLQDRGGIQYLIRAYFEEFTDKDEVSLCLKINPAYGIPDLNKLIKEISPRNENLPELIINPNNIPYNKMVDLYNSATVFVSPTRAEAYNLPCIEAMACGLPVITTNYGGQTDFMTDLVNGLLVKYKLEEVEHEVMYEGIKWATPSIEDLRLKLRFMYENQKEIKRMGEEAIKTAKENTWDITAEKIKQLI